MLTLAQSYLHTLDPFAIRFPAGWPFGGVRWYGLSYAAGFVFAWFLYRWFAKTGRSPLKVEQVGDLIMYMIVGVLAGGRLGYVLFYQISLLWDFTGSLPFWGVLAINKGGMASHGGIIGFIVAVTLFAKRRGVSALHLLDIGALSCTVGLGLGRIANFVNGELWGKALPASQQPSPPWWSVKYPREITDNWLRAALSDMPPTSAQVAHLADVARDFNLSAPTTGELQSLVVEEAARRLNALEPLRNEVSPLGDFFEAVVNAAYAGNEAVASHITPLLTAYYPSQLFQATTDGPLLAIVLVVVWLRPRKPGVVGSWFLIAYAVMRIISELFRQPDEGVALLLGLSRGQALSALMFLSGCIALRIASRLNVEKLPGLLSAANHQQRRGNNDPPASRSD